jgi:putative DNA primase/helicase
MAEEITLLKRAAERFDSYIAGRDKEFPEPLPLPKLPPVPEFPLDILPDDLAPWIGDAADRARFRPDFAAVASMAALGSLIGRKIAIRMKRCDDWSEYANVWAALVGPPSALKSPAMREALRPFKALQVTADDRYEKERERFEIEFEAYKVRKEAKKKAAVKALARNPNAAINLGDEIEPPTEPVERIYWTSDVTPEKLGEILAKNPTGILIERDELSSLLSALELEDDRHSTLRGLLLSGWSGKEGYRFDRIIRGKTYLPKFAISVVGGIQPGPLMRYVRSAFSGEKADGLLQRFQLIVWPDPAPFEYVDRFPDSEARRKAAELFERADTFNPDSIGTHDEFSDVPYIRLSAEAQERFIGWYTNFMRERRQADAEGSESAPLAAHFGKYPGLLGKLSLILHIADEPEARAVSERTLLKALAWLEYLTPHARRVYHAVSHPETGTAELLLAKLRRGELPVNFKAWEITKKGWAGLTDREAVKRACRLLLEYNWLIEVDAGGASGGRPADPVYAVSPAVEKMSEKID